MLKSRAPWVVLAGAYALLVQELVRISLTGQMHTMDNLLVVDAVRRLLGGGSPYESDRFLYPPSSVPFALVLTPLSDTQLERLFPWGLAVLLLVGWWAALRLFGVGLRSWLGVAGVAAFALFNPAVSVVELGNWTAPVAALMAVALLLMGRGRWLAAGVVIGVSIAVKPMLVPIGLVFLLARKWRGLAAAAGIPVVACAVVTPLLPEPELFFTRTLPFLLGGQDEFARPYDSSLPAMLPRIGIDGAPLVVVRVAVLAVAVATAVLRWRNGGDERLRLVDTSAIVMIGTFLVSTPAFGYYPLVVLLPLVASVVVRGSAARSVWFWVASVPLVRPLQFIGVDFLDGGHAGYRQAAKPLAWMVVAGTLLLVRTLRGDPAPPRPELPVQPAAREPERLAATSSPG
ncbi:glycosyltransferase family 87 protein [Dactylosporangium sp. CA-139114]|uniref:glycosyltransferase family 87 protein n=1 Tax=Dactylosporangium sp. CA-139114 TaxID=3239931 RepID=UPI003D960AE5